MTPAVFNVNDFSDQVDTNPGNGSIDQLGGPGAISLRAALMEAVAQGGNHTINLAAGTYQLTLAGGGPDAAFGDLDISGSGLALTIVGTDSGPVIIQQTILDRVFEITGGASVTLNNVTITGGHTDSSLGGGGVRVDNASLVLRNTSVVGNTADFSGGAAGGGVNFFTSSGHRLTIINSTIAENSSTGPGGAVYVYRGSAGTAATIEHTTIAYNSGFSSSLYNASSGAEIELKNSIVYHNTDTAGGTLDVGGEFTSGSTHNIVENVASYAPGFSASQNRIGSAWDPALGTLDYHGGTTLVYDLFPGSAAIDYADSSLLGDQRWYPRPEDGDGDSIAAPDAGAYEAPAAPKTTVSGMVSGHLWYDANADGIRDYGELSAPNVKVKLYWSNGDFLGSTTTDANGFYYLYLEVEPRPTPDAVLHIVVATPNGNYGWTTKDVGADDDVDSDLNGSGISDAFIFPEDNFGGGGSGSFSALSFNFPPSDGPPTPLSSVLIDGGLVYDPRDSEDPSEYPDPIVVGPDKPDPYSFFYKVPFAPPVFRQTAFTTSPIGVDFEPNSLGDQTPRGEQAFLNVYKVVEVGPRRLTERIAVLSIDEADPNVAQGVLGAAAPGRYRLTVQDRLGEELVWEGDLPFNFSSAQSGVQKAWK
ncbi:MAG TPA: SdrD B-like domain-containing protein, partial [Pirellulales bacterium]